MASVPNEVKKILQKHLSAGKSERAAAKRKMATLPDAIIFHCLALCKGNRKK